MIEKEKQLWEKISQFQFDDERIDFNFSHRLARENNWTISYSKKVIDEYKKFIFLCCITKTGVTPSDQVDQVWHLHLTYSKSYWIDLCQNTLEKEIHHNPTKGGQSEANKFDDYYTKTKEEYIKMFQVNPPIDIWPDNDKRFGDVHYQRINISKNWIISKPNLKWRTVLFGFGITFLASFLIQAKSNDNKSFAIVLIIVFFAMIAYYFRNNNNGKGNGCSSGCGGNSSSGDSGCSSHGCSSGCSGCGGGCGS
jgi:hypothetical protein